MNIEMYATLAVLGIGVAVWAIKKYQTVMADGKVTLDELIDTVKEGEEKVKETAEVVEEAIEKTE